MAQGGEGVLGAARRRWAAARARPAASPGFAPGAAPPLCPDPWRPSGLAAVPGACMPCAEHAAAAAPSAATLARVPCCRLYLHFCVLTCCLDSPASRERNVGAKAARPVFRFFKILSGSSIVGNSGCDIQHPELPPAPEPARCPEFDPWQLHTLDGAVAQW